MWSVVSVWNARGDGQKCRLPACLAADSALCQFPVTSNCLQRVESPARKWIGGLAASAIPVCDVSFQFVMSWWLFSQSGMEGVVRRLPAAWAIDIYGLSRLLTRSCDLKSASVLHDGGGLRGETRSANGRCSGVYAFVPSGVKEAWPQLEHPNMKGEED